MAKYSYHRVDANQREIRDALEAVGATCDVRCPSDLLVGYRGQNYLLEVKTDKGKERPTQLKFKARWKGHYALVRSVSDALAALGLP